MATERSTAGRTAGPTAPTLFFAESSNNWGGQEAQLLQQASALAAQGASVHVLCRPQGRLYAFASQAAQAKSGLQVHPVAFRNALHGPSLLAVGRLLRQHQPQAVVCHSGHDANVCGLVAKLLAALGLARPRMVRVRTYQPGVPSAFAYRYLFHTTLVPSQALRTQLLQNPRIPPSRVQVLYPGIDFEHIAQDAQPQPLSLIPPGAGPLIVHAAMLRPEKGHAFMLQVLAKLLSQHPHAWTGLHYAVLGEGETLAALQTQVVALGLQRHVSFLGLQKPIAPWLAAANVVVMPSSYEPLGMSQIEALGLGVPVVVSNVGGLPETVQHGQTGWVCPAPGQSGAVQAWAQALQQVFANPAGAKAMALRGQAAVRQQFSVQANLAGLVQACGLPGLSCFK